MAAFLLHISVTKILAQSISSNQSKSTSAVSTRVHHYLAVPRKAAGGSGGLGRRDKVEVEEGYRGAGPDMRSSDDVSCCGDVCEGDASVLVIKSNAT